MYNPARTPVYPPTASQSRNELEVATEATLTLPTTAYGHTNGENMRKRARADSESETDDEVDDLVEQRHSRAYEDHAASIRNLTRHVESTSHQYLVLHRVNCSQEKSSVEDHSSHSQTACYLDIPRMYKKDSRGHALRGNQPVFDVQDHLEDNAEIVLIVYRDYDCNDYHRNIANDFEKQVPDNMNYQLYLQHRPWFFSLVADAELASPTAESIYINSVDLEDALDDLVASKPHALASWRMLQTAHTLLAPYDYFYHHGSMLRDILGRVLQPTAQSLVITLLDYIEDTHGALYQEAERVFRSGFVSRELFTKLFIAKELIVSKDNGLFQAYLVDHIRDITPEGIGLECFMWAFDGTFRKAPVFIHVQWPSKSEGKIPITQLVAYPLRLDQTGLQDKLLARGEEFWSCRRKKLVGYKPWDRSDFELHTTNPRYMVDLATHRYLYPDKYPPLSREQQEAPAVEASAKEPPDEPFLILLPPTILGFGFHDKKWRTLQIDNIAPVKWNREAFKKLVLKPNKKELIQALVAETLEKNKAADIVDDKGNGLILLLHGSPGTGKTLTAESIAELTEKPLYRVTCGDLGTEPQDVETYLESALYIGTVWECVVLLDEADVFLEERTQTDLVRNALVSVFLRVLEYYNGILLLTSNRVLTFDEAFKSRMQLAIQYPKLGETNREEIWMNFFDALHAAEVEMDFDEIKRKVRFLARSELNGRQIRNTIKTARQLAKFLKQKFSSEHIVKVLDVANEFEEYSKQRRGYTDDDWAEAEKLR